MMGSRKGLGIFRERGARKGSRRGRLGRRIAIGLVALAAFLALPLVFPDDTSTAVAAAPCDMSPDLSPDIVAGGVDGLIKPPVPDPAQPGAQAAAPVAQGNYATYGMSGQFWHTHLLGCDDIAAVMGNAMANTVFLWAKALDRLTITTYQAAATEACWSRSRTSSTTWWSAWPMPCTGRTCGRW